MHTPVHIRKVVTANRRGKLDSTRMAVDPLLWILQDLDVCALVLLSELIDPEQADRETRDVENVV